MPKWYQFPNPPPPPGWPPQGISLAAAREIFPLLFTCPSGVCYWQARLLCVATGDADPPSQPHLCSCPCRTLAGFTFLFLEMAIPSVFTQAAVPYKEVSLHPPALGHISGWMSPPPFPHCPQDGRLSPALLSLSTGPPSLQQAPGPMRRPGLVRRCSHPAAGGNPCPERRDLCDRSADKGMGANSV